MPILRLLLLILLTSQEFAQAQTSYTGHGAESVPTEIVKKYAPPTLDSDLSRKINSLLDIRTPGSGILSPDGKRLFFGWRVTGTSQVWRLDGPKSFPVQLTGGEDQTSLQEITPDGKRIILSRDRGGEENPGLYWQSADGGPLNLIQHKKKVQTVFGFVSADSKFVFYLANDIKESSYAIYRYAFATNESELLLAKDGFWRIVDNRNAKEFLLAKYRGTGIVEFHAWKLGEPDTTPLFGHNENEYYAAHFGSKPGELIVLTAKFGEYRRLFSLIGEKWKPISPEINWDVSHFGIDEKRKRIYYEMNENGYGRTFVLDAKTYKQLKFPKFPNAYQISVQGLSSNARWAVLTVDQPRAPRANYVFDWQSRKLQEWTKPSTPEFDVSTFPTTETEHYLAADGTKIPLLVRRPEKCKTQACPVIVSFHGGPEGQSRPGFTAIGHLYAEAGYIVAEPNVRGSEGYGKSWLGADDGAKRLQVITDIRDCANYIRKNWKVTKIGVIGGSYGGYAAQIAMTMFAGSYDAGVSIVGISNLLTFLQNTAPYRRALRINEYGDPEKDAEALKELSPTTHIAKLKDPILIIQGLNDPRVPAGEAIQIHEALIKRKIPSELVIFADEGHGTSKRENVVKQIGYSFKFFEKHLKDAKPEENKKVSRNE